MKPLQPKAAAWGGCLPAKSSHSLNPRILKRQTAWIYELQSRSASVSRTLSYRNDVAAGEKTMRGEWIRKPKSRMSVVFVHGILSSGETCWQHENGAYWPRLLYGEAALQELGIYVYT